MKKKAYTKSIANFGNFHHNSIESKDNYGESYHNSGKQLELFPLNPPEIELCPSVFCRGGLHYQVVLGERVLAENLSCEQALSIVKGGLS